MGKAVFSTNDRKTGHTHRKEMKLTLTLHHMQILTQMGQRPKYNT